MSSKIKFIASAFLVVSLFGLTVLDTGLKDERSELSLAIYSAPVTGDDGGEMILEYGLGTLETDASGNVTVDLNALLAELDRMGVETAWYEILKNRVPISERMELTEFAAESSRSALRRELPAEGDEVLDDMAIGLEVGTSGEDVNFTADRIGIGTATPGAILDINASTYNGPAVIVDRYGPGAVPSIEAGTSNAWLMLDGNRTANGNVGLNHYSSGHVILVNGGGNVGIGTSSPAYKLDVSGTGRFTGQVTVPGTPSAATDAASKGYVDGLVGGISFTETDPTWSGTANTTSNIGRTGNVGIGTTSPTDKLHVAGNIRHTGGLVSQGASYASTWMNYDEDVYGNSLILGAGGLTAIGAGESAGQVRANIGPSSETLYLASDGGINIVTNLQSGWASRVDAVTVASAGNVGIGFTSPSYKLDVNGTGRFTGQLTVPATPTASTSAASKGYVDGLIGGGVGTGTSGQTLRHNGTNWVGNGNLYNNGTNVGVGTTAPYTKFEVNGNISIPSGSEYRFITGGTGWEWAMGRDIVATTDVPNAGIDIIGYGDHFQIIDVDGVSPSYTYAALLDIDMATGNTGIGTTSPASKLDVNGTIRADNYRDSAGGALIRSGTGISVSEDGDGSWLVTATGTGSVSGSGTTNYIPKWSGSTSLNNSAIYQSGSNILIGTTTSTSEMLNVVNYSYGNGAVRGANQSGTSIYAEGYLGVLDYSSLPGTPYNVGVLGIKPAVGGDGAAVYAWSQDVNTENWAVYAVSNGATGTNYGIYATAANGATNWAGYFAGNVNITGNLSVSGSFPGDNLGNHTATTNLNVGAHNLYISSGYYVGIAGDYNIYIDDANPTWYGNAYGGVIDIRGDNSIAGGLLQTGGIDVARDIEVNGEIYFIDANTYITRGSGNSLRIQTNSGYTEIGPQNTSWSHFYTDRSQFYFDRPIGVNGNVFPYTDNARDLGNGTGAAWRNLYLDGGLYAAGSLGSSGQVLHTNGSTVYWSTDDNSGGDITAVYAGNDLDGGGTSGAPYLHIEPTLDYVDYINDLYRLSGVATNSYDKIRVWSTAPYAIGMYSAHSFGYLNDYAMTFTMNNDIDRGFLWRDESDATTDGAMSLTTDGRLTVKSIVSAPIYYDYNNTGYYCDPNSTSRLYRTNVNYVNVYNYLQNSGSTYGGYVASADNFVPITTGGYDLGNSSYRWRYLWVNGIYLNGSYRSSWPDALPSGSTYQTLYYNGSAWTANSVLTVDASNARIGTSGSSTNDLYICDYIYDWDNTGYYIDINSTSRMYRINADYLYSYNWVYGSQFIDVNNTAYFVDPASYSYTNYFDRNYGYNGVEYDWNNTAYYLDPASTSICNDLRANIFYDYGNTGYYLDPASYSYLYYIYGSYMQSYTYYDRNNTAYYMDPASTSNVYHIRVNGIFYDSSGDAGSSGQVLSSTGSGTNWIDPPSGEVVGCATPSCGSTNSGTITPSTSSQYAAYSAGAIPYWHFAATAGRYYSFSLCSNSEDSYLRIFNSSCTQIAANDDNGDYCSGVPASIKWYCGTTGNYTVTASHYSCGGFSSSGSMQYWWSSSLLREIPGGGFTAAPAEFYANGSSVLEEGMKMVSFSSDYTRVTQGVIPTVVVTPLGDCNGIFVTDVTTEGFTVKEMMSGVSDIDFNWIAIANPSVTDWYDPHEIERIALKDDYYSDPAMHSYEEWQSMFKDIECEFPFTYQEYMNATADAHRSDGGGSSQ